MHAPQTGGVRRRCEDEEEGEEERRGGGEEEGLFMRLLLSSSLLWTGSCRLGLRTLQVLDPGLASRVAVASAVG